MDTAEKIKWASAVIGHDKYKTTLSTDTHVIIGDEPIDNGGQDVGPGPGDLLRMSLASCTAITLRMYADRKGYDIDQIEVKVNTKEVDNKTIFTRQIVITGHIEDHVRKRMMQIANACPVHKMLTRPIEVITQLI